MSGDKNWYCPNCGPTELDRGGECQKCGSGHCIAFGGEFLSLSELKAIEKGMR